MAVDVAPAVARGQDALGARLVVSAVVAPALLVRVRELAVELDGKLVLLVVGVAVDGLCRRSPRAPGAGTAAGRAPAPRRAGSGIRAPSGCRRRRPSRTSSSSWPPAYFLAQVPAPARALAAVVRRLPHGLGQPAAGIVEGLRRARPGRARSPPRSSAAAGGRAGWPRLCARTVRTTSPGALIRRVEGTVTKMASAGGSRSPCSSAAVRRLSTAPGPARSTAAQSQAVRGGGPVKAAYTPR